MEDWARANTEDGRLIGRGDKATEGRRGRERFGRKGGQGRGSGKARGEERREREGRTEEVCAWDACMSFSPSIHHPI